MQDHTAGIDYRYQAWRDPQLQQDGCFGKNVFPARHCETSIYHGVGSGFIQHIANGFESGRAAITRDEFSRQLSLEKVFNRR